MLTLDEMVGQLLLVGFNGDDVSDQDVERIAEYLAKGLLSGVIFFRHNIKNSASVLAINTLFKQSSPLPPLLSLDQEGGKVLRLLSTKEYELETGMENVATLTARYVRERYKVQDAERQYHLFAQWLAQAGFNLNFAPCVDLDLGSPESIISRYERSFSQDPKEVTAYANAFINAHDQAGVLTCIKHFPGHGFASGDTHAGLVDISKTHKPEELYPFAQLLKRSQPPMLMASHLVHHGMDPEHPIGFSERTIASLVRAELSFDGVIVSDDLHMGAILDNYSFDEALALSLNAGVDLLVFSNNPKASLGKNRLAYDPNLVERAHDQIKAMITKGIISKENVEAAYERVVRLKKRLL